MVLNMTDSQLVGRRVVSQDGHVIGDVASLVVDTESWRVIELGVKLERKALEPLHLKKPVLGTHTVRLPIDDVSGLGDALVLRSRLDELRFAADEQVDAAGTTPMTEAEGPRPGQRFDTDGDTIRTQVPPAPKVG
jgi:sporulation protein YlmC with PRC-barrel domain